MNTRPLISVKNLSAGYKKRKHTHIILHGISFELSGAELVGLAGSNGIGKSTLLKTMAGLIPSLSGGIELHDRPIKSYKKEEIAKSISIVLTGKIPTGNLRAGEMIAMGRYPYTNWYGVLNDHDMARVNEAMDLTGSAGYQDQPVYELSDGQLQKALIARALAQDCGIILLDEPTAHLDLVNKIMIMKLLKDLSEKTGKAILIATHELDLAMQVCDRLMLLMNPETLVTGTPEDLVLDGTIRKFIHHADVNFDPELGKFLPVRSSGKRIGLEGPQGITRYWTRNALERNGYAVSEDQNAVSVTILESPGENTSWKIMHPGGEEFVHSIAALAGNLKKIY